MLDFSSCSVDAKLNRMSYVIEKTSVPADRSRIDVADPVEVRWWSRLLGCSPRQLLDAVSRVGDCAARVEQLIDSWSGFGLAVRMRSGAAA